MSLIQVRRESGTRGFGFLGSGELVIQAAFSGNEYAGDGEVQEFGDRIVACRADGSIEGSVALGHGVVDDSEVWGVGNGFCGLRCFEQGRSRGCCEPAGALGGSDDQAFRLRHFDVAAAADGDVEQRFVNLVRQSQASAGFRFWERFGAGAD